MKIALTGLKKLGVDYTRDELKIPSGWMKLDVSHCAVCRTDAKIWRDGHRDLSLPRVPGHEIVVEIDGAYHVVWPGISCKRCKYCLRGEENLCDDMQILGFHRDGGFADQILVPETSLIPTPAGISPLVASFAEPAGCIINAFDKLKLKAGENILIYGAGTVGLLAAIMAKEYGARPLVVENNELKIFKAKEFVAKTDIAVQKETHESNFDCVLNACADPLALFNAIVKTDKGGRIAFFSGLNKNEQLESNLLNLVHYKEMKLMGAYGLQKNDMARALPILQRNGEAIQLLIEKQISPEQVEEVLPLVLNAESYKFIIDCRGAEQAGDESIPKKTNQDSIETSDQGGLSIKIQKIPEEIRAQAQHKIDFKTKPFGALGKLEQISVQMSCIQGTLYPSIKEKALFVFAADHGIAEEGVSAFPQEVTQQMVRNFLNEGAAINVLCSHNNIDLSIVDMGVKGKSLEHQKLINKKVGQGTRNFALEPAMIMEQAKQALQAGMDVFYDANRKRKLDIIGLGEMGIANTTSATAIISIVTGKSIDECTGRGTGVDNEGLSHKVKVIKKALAFQNPESNNGMDILSKVGGFEIAGMAGAALAAASQGCAVVLDGLISTSAGLIAYLINPLVAQYFISGHHSVEKGHIFALEHLGITPLLDLDFRLGEGTGAALSIDLADAACKIMCDMASFDEAGVSFKKDS